MEENRDLLSDTNMDYLSYILFCFVPIKLTQRLHYYFIRQLSTSCKLTEVTGNNLPMQPAGSSVEGLGCSGTKPGNHNFDFDIMICDKRGQFIIEDTVNPGYVRLIPIQPLTWEKNCLTIISSSANIYLNSNIFRDEKRDSLFGTTGKERWKGPAHQIGDYTEDVFEQDFVFCVKYPDWPEEFVDYVKRNRTAGWPSDEIVLKIHNTECHFVPTSHPSSQHPDIEWRYSFSQAEVELANTLTAYQKHIYVIVKELCKFALKESKHFKTYYLKTTFFWCCKRIPTRFWIPSYYSYCCLAIMDTFLKYLAKDKVPHFFIPGCNLISRLNKEDVRNMLQKIIILRCNVGEYMHKYHDQNEFFPVARSGFFSAQRQCLIGPPRGENCFDKNKLAQQTLELMLDLVYMGKNSLAVDYMLSFQHFFNDQSMLNYTHFLRLNYLCFSSERPNTSIEPMMSHFKVLYAVSQALCFSDLSECKDTFFNSVKERFDDSLKTLHELNAEEKYQMLVYRCAFFLTSHCYLEAYHCARDILNQINLQGYMEIGIDSPLLCTFLPDYSSAYAGTIPVSEYASYVLLTCGKKLNEPIDLQDIRDIYARKRDFQKYGINKVACSLIAEAHLDIDLYVPAIFEFLYSYVHFRIVYICLLLELLSIRSNEVVVNEVCFRLLVTKTMTNLFKKGECNVENDIDEINDLLEFLWLVYETADDADNQFIHYKQTMVLCASILYGSGKMDVLHRVLSVNGQHECIQLLENKSGRGQIQKLNDILGIIVVKYLKRYHTTIDSRRTTGLHHLVVLFDLFLRILIGQEY